MILRNSFCVLLVAFTGVVSTAGETIVGWRSDTTGRYPDAEPVTTWSARKNIIWRTALPAESNSSPVIIGRRLFVHSEPSTLHCVNVVDGHILWQRENAYEDVLSPEEMQTLGDALTLPDSHESNGHSTAVPVTNGSAVFAAYGTGVVAAYNMDGERLWARFLQRPSHRWGHSSSPTLSGNTLIVQIDDIFALDTATGATRWTSPTEPGWGTPLLSTIDSTPVVITSRRGDVFRLSDGLSLGSGAASLEYATPVIVDGIIYSIEDRSIARTIPDKLAENGIRFDVHWQSRIKGSRHYASPLIHEGLIYTISREARLSVLDQKTGELVYEKKLTINHGNTNSVYTSVTLGGDYIFMGCEEGITLVLKPGRKYEEVARNNLEPYRSTPVFIGDRMYMRGLRNLYCIGPPH